MKTVVSYPEILTKVLIRPSPSPRKLFSWFLSPLKVPAQTPNLTDMKLAKSALSSLINLTNAQNLTQLFGINKLYQDNLKTLVACFRYTGKKSPYYYKKIGETDIQ